MSKIVCVILVIIMTHMPSFAKIKVAITIDDLPSHSSLPPDITRSDIAEKILAVLTKYNIPEVYGFINAKSLENEPELLRILKLWRTSGYFLGNHTYSHPDLNQITLNNFILDIKKNESILNKLGRGTKWKYFRYPFLHEGNSFEKRTAVRTFLAQNGYEIAQVTIDFDDWAWNQPYTNCLKKNDHQTITWLQETYLQNAQNALDRAERISKFLFKRSIPHILLLHIGAFDAEMLDSLIATFLKTLDVEFISLSDALKDEVYSVDPEQISDNGLEFIYQILKSRGLTIKDIPLPAYEEVSSEKLKNACMP